MSVSYEMFFSRDTPIVGGTQKFIYKNKVADINYKVILPIKRNTAFHSFVF